MSHMCYFRGIWSSSRRRELGKVMGGGAGKVSQGDTYI